MDPYLEYNSPRIERIYNYLISWKQLNPLECVSFNFSISNPVDSRIVGMSINDITLYIGKAKDYYIHILSNNIKPLGVINLTINSNGIILDQKPSNCYSYKVYNFLQICGLIDSKLQFIKEVWSL